MPGEQGEAAGLGQGLGGSEGRGCGGMVARKYLWPMLLG